MAGDWRAVSTELLAEIRAHYLLDWRGIHGIHHWERVRDNGLLLTRRSGADPRVIEYFAALHDSARLNDDHDPHHGTRAAAWIEALDPSLIGLAEPQRVALLEACRTHTFGTATDDPTIATCWDADRLDLLRVGIRPDPRFLVTEAARDPDMIRWAMARSRDVPRLDL